MHRISETSNSDVPLTLPAPAHLCLLVQRNACKEEEAPRTSTSREDRGVFIDSFQLNKYAYGPIHEGDGVMFVTYSSLVAGSRDGKSRLKQVLVRQ